MNTSHLFWIVLLIFCVLGQGACSDDDDDDNDDDSAGDDDDNDDNDDTADTVTSASPGLGNALLTDSHAGYGDAGCFDCHDDVHQGGFALGECTTCHGANGAPFREAGHANTGCTACHETSHADLPFVDPHHCTACHRYEPDLECPVTESYDVVVIGAGGGGISAATALAKEGLSVALVEKHYKVGGYMNRFHRQDYSFEISLHAISGLGDPDDSDTLVRLGVFDRLKPVQADPIYRAVFPNGDYFIPADIDQYRQYLKTQFPDEAAGIDALFDELTLHNEILSAVMRMTNDFALDDLMTVLFNFEATLRLLRTLNMTLTDFTTQFIQDTALKGLFELLVVFIGSGPSESQAVFFNAMWNSYHRNGYFYLEGGSGAIVNAIKDVFLENGGTLKLNTLATRIVIDDGRAVQVRTEHGACLNTRYVVSNANAPDTVFKLIGEENLPDAYVQSVGDMEISVATLQIFMGVDKDFREQFNGTHEIFVNESVDMDQNYQYIYDGRTDLAPYIIANYSVVDPTVAPQGKNTLVMSTYLPYDWNNTWSWNLGYDPYLGAKEQAAMVFIERMEQFLPNLGDHIEVLEVGTPLTNQAFTLNPMGTIYGWSNTPEQGTLRRLPQDTPIENLFLAGAWTQIGGGQATVLGSGLAAADKILDLEKAGR